MVVFVSVCTHTKKINLIENQILGFISFHGIFVIDLNVLEIDTKMLSRKRAIFFHVLRFVRLFCKKDSIFVTFSSFIHMYINTLARPKKHS